MRIFTLRTCDTCRRALAELREAGLDPEVIDVRADGVAPDDLRAMWAALGDALVNRRSTTWRALDPAERDGDPLALLSAHPTLIKRPVIEAGGGWRVGWTPAIRTSVLGTGGAGD